MNIQNFAQLRKLPGKCQLGVSNSGPVLDTLEGPKRFIAVHLQC